MIISEKIFRVLEERGMSQKQFADLTGITPSTICDWKRKKTNPASNKIMVICDALQITPYELLSGTEGEKFKQPDYVIVEKSSKDYTFLEAYRELDLKKQERLMKYLTKLAGE